MAMPEKFYRVAVLCSMSLMAQQILQGFARLFRDKKNNILIFPYSMRHYDEVGYRHCAQEIVDGEYDLVVLIGCLPTKSFIEHISGEKYSIPIIYTAVLDPEIQQMVRDTCLYSTNISFTQQSGLQAVQVLHECNPLMRSLLVVHDPLRWSKTSAYPIFNRYVLEVTEYCRQNHIQVDFYADPNKSYPYKIKEIIADYDSVLTVEGYISSEKELFLGLMCSERGKVCMASNLEQAQRGVTSLTFSPDYKIMVEKVFDESLRVLLTAETGAKPYFQKVSLEDARLLCMNYDQAKKQGIDPEHVLFVINKYRGRVF